jgi:Trypsin-like peptidase domain
MEISASVRAVLFATEFEEHPYATHGGTLFVVNFQGKLFGITCRHVFGDFPAEGLLVTQEKQGKKGSRFAAIQGIRYPSAPRRDAVDTDITDLCVVEFSSEVAPDFFFGTAFPIDDQHAATANLGDALTVFGMLKNATSIDGPDISVSWCRLEFTDTGHSSDPTLRQAMAVYEAPQFDSVTGLSGAPVFNELSHKLCGMVVRGGIEGDVCMIRYIDVFDIIRLLEAVVVGHEATDYSKVMAR